MIILSQSIGAIIGGALFVLAGQLFFISVGGSIVDLGLVLFGLGSIAGMGMGRLASARFERQAVDRPRNQVG